MTLTATTRPPQPLTHDRSGGGISRRLNELGVHLQLTRLPSGEYQALDQNRYDGPESNAVAVGADPWDAILELLATIEPRMSCGRCGQPMTQDGPCPVCRTHVVRGLNDAEQ